MLIIYYILMIFTHTRRERTRRVARMPLIGVWNPFVDQLRYAAILQRAFNIAINTFFFSRA